MYKYQKVSKKINYWNICEFNIQKLIIIGKYIAVYTKYTKQTDIFSTLKTITMDIVKLNS